MVSIEELQLNDAEEQTSEPCSKTTIDAKIESSGPGTPDAAEQADDTSSVENCDVIEEERKERAQEVTLAA